MISVIIPCYNAENTINETIMSIINQSIDDTIEIIIVDDFSIDKSWSIISEWSLKMKNNPKFIFVPVRNNENRGVCYCRNLAIELANGEYISFLDADDYWDSEILFKEKILIMDKKCAFVYSGRQLITENSKLTNKIINVPICVTYDDMLRKNSITCSSVMIESSVAKKYKMERDDLHEDYIYFAKIIKNYRSVYGINEPLVYYRTTKNGRSYNKIKSAIRRFRCYGELGLNLLERIPYFVCYAIDGISKHL